MAAFLQFSTIALGLVILFTSFSPLCRMAGGFNHFCHKAKYLLSMLAALVFIFYASKGVCLFGMSIACLTVFTFIWPRLVWWGKNKAWPEVRFWFEFKIKPNLFEAIIPAGWLSFFGLMLLLFAACFYWAVPS